MINLTVNMMGIKLCAAMIFLVLALMITGCSGNKEAGRAEKPQQVAAKAPAGKDQSDKKLEKAPEKPAAADRPQLEVVTKGVSLTWEEAGKLKMQASASEIVGDELTGKGTMKNAKVLWYDNGQLTTVINAPRIDAEKPTQVLTASGGVTVRSIPRKTVIKAQWLKWYAKDHMVKGNGGVTVTSDMGTINAAGFVADTELKTIKFVSHGNGGSASFKP